MSIFAVLILLLVVVSMMEPKGTSSVRQPITVLRSSDPYRDAEEVEFDRWLTAMLDGGFYMQGTLARCRMTGRPVSQRILKCCCGWYGLDAEDRERVRKLQAAQRAAMARGTAHRIDGRIVRTNKRGVIVQ